MEFDMRMKQTWKMAQLGRIHVEGRTLVIPGRLTNDPDRVVELAIPASQVERVILAQMRELSKLPTAEIESVTT